MVYRRNPGRPLNVRQQKFVEQFLITGNGREAAIRAGYSRSGALSSSRLRKIPYVAEAIRRGRAAAARSAQVERDRVVLELARVAFSDIGEVLDWTSGDDVTLRPKTAISPHHRAAIAEIAPRRMGQGPRIKFHNKARALEALARHLGVYDKTVPAVDPAQLMRQRQATREKIMRRINQIVEERIAERCKAGTLIVVEPGPNAGAKHAAADSTDQSPPPQPSPLEGEGREGGEASSPVTPALGEGSASPGRTFPPGFALPRK